MEGKNLRTKIRHRLQFEVHDGRRDAGGQEVRARDARGGYDARRKAL